MDTLSADTCWVVDNSEEVFKGIEVERSVLALETDAYNTLDLDIESSAVTLHGQSFG